MPFFGYRWQGLLNRRGDFRDDRLEVERAAAASPIVDARRRAPLRSSVRSWRRRNAWQPPPGCRPAPSAGCCGACYALKNRSESLGGAVPACHRARPHARRSKTRPRYIDAGARGVTFSIFSFAGRLTAFRRRLGLGCQPRPANAAPPGRRPRPWPRKRRRQGCRCLWPVR